MARALTAAGILHPAGAGAPRLLGVLAHGIVEARVLWCVRPVEARAAAPLHALQCTPLQGLR